MEQKSLDSKFLCLLSRGPVPRFWDNTYNNLKKLGISLEQSEFYSINSHGLRSDEFITNHDGKHILFAGCSNTFGLGNFLEDVWSYKVYKEIEKNEKVSGYFNIGSPGATISEISYQIFVYCKDYGYPDTVFINLPFLSFELTNGIAFGFNPFFIFCRKNSLCPVVLSRNTPALS